MSSAEAAAADPQDIRPVVPTGPTNDWGMWAFGMVLLVGGAVLYNALSASDQQIQAPSVFAPSEQQGARIASPPPLRTPERFDEPVREPVTVAEQVASISPVIPRQPAFVPQVIQPVAPRTEALPALSAGQPEPESEARFTDGPEVIFDAAAARPTTPVSAQRETEGTDRVTADRLRNPSFTIPQGTVIPAVLETALDSTRAGGVRALVQRDVSSFDGSRVLIPRGSRLYGEYEANLRSGQNRALVQWTRLIRPDGVTIALDSPSSDPLGRAGVRGRVDTKFFQRFGGAILQTVLDIGTGLAINEATDGVFIALPGSTQSVQIAQPDQIQPTLKVRHGTSVSVFVARDLDFSSVDR